jgi:single-strand DNA-binding protein
VQANRFEVSGYLSAKPILRTLPSGTPVANVRLGQTYLYDGKDGRGKQTNWFNLAFYGALAKVAMSYEKGDNINVVGSLQQRQFTPKDGSTRTVHEVIVQKCHRIAGQRDSLSSAGPGMPEVNRGHNEPVGEQPASSEQDDAWAVL